jgi:hypothetical protein
MESQPSWAKARILGFSRICLMNDQIWAIEIWIVPMTKQIRFTISLLRGSKLDSPGMMSFERKELYANR